MFRRCIARVFNRNMSPLSVHGESSSILRPHSANSSATREKKSWRGCSMISPLPTRPTSRSFGGYLSGPNGWLGFGFLHTAVARSCSSAMSHLPERMVFTKRTWSCSAPALNSKNANQARGCRLIISADNAETRTSSCRFEIPNRKVPWNCHDALTCRPFPKRSSTKSCCG